MPEIVDRGRKDQKAIGPLPLGGPRDPGRLARSILVDAAHHGHGPGHLVQRYPKNALLLLEGERRNLEAWALVVMPVTPSVSRRYRKCLR